jgi:hypothetical protein
VTSATYTINGPVAQPTFSVPGGGYAEAQTVALSTTTPGAIIRFTTDGTNPWVTSPIYTTPISVPATATIKAYATKQDFVDSSMASASYVISTGSNITINFANNQTVIQPKTGGTVTTTATSTLSGLVAMVGSNPVARLTLTGNGTFTWDASVPGGITDLVINSGSNLVAQGYSTGDGRDPSLGNGHLVLSIAGSLTVNSGGRITMDSLGYTQNRSFSGVNLGGAGRNGGGCSAGGGGGYGSSGFGGSLAGAAFGSADFSTALYLGSGGSAGQDCGYDTESWAGGRGGGAIAITAVNIYNSGTISARGQNSQGTAGAGSGGTIFLNASGTLSNTGTITAAGGAGSGWSTQVPGGSGRLKFQFGSLGVMTGTVTGLMSDAGVTYSSVLAVFNGTSSLVHSVNGVTATAFIVPLTSASQIASFVGSQYPALAFSGAGTFTFDGAYNFGSRDLSLVSGQTININSNVQNIRNITVNSGGALNINAALQGLQNVTINAGGSLALNSDMGTVKNLTVAGTIFGPAFNSTAGDGTAATFGNGHLILNVEGTVSVTSTGKINMDGRGYTANRSFSGLNLGGAGRTNGCGGTSGSYGTLGTGGMNVFGENNFTSSLYLGSGGGSTTGCSGYDGPYTIVGTNGGGSIKVNAQVIGNAGSISANGADLDHNQAGLGSGGTIVLLATSSFSNTGTISAEGGSSRWNRNLRGGSGRIKISYNT